MHAHPAQCTGDKVEPRPEEMVLPPDADGRQRHLRKLDEKLVHRSTLELGPRPGKAMKVWRVGTGGEGVKGGGTDFNTPPPLPPD